MIYYKFFNPEPIYYFCEIDYVHKTEKWLPIKGYEGIYEVSDLGRVKSLKYGVKILKQGLTKGGYLIVAFSLYGKIKSINVHFLVMESFLNHKSQGLKMVIDHINHIKLDNNLINLRIITNRENTNKKHVKPTSRYTGTRFIKKTNKWVSTIYHNKKSIHIGSFDTEREAGMAYENYIQKKIVVN